MKTFKAELSVDSINKLIEQLEGYSKSLKTKNKRFTDSLLDRGIQVAEQSISTGTHTMPDRIMFYKELEKSGSAVKGLMIGVGSTFFSHWYEEDGTEHHDEVYPLAMMEFGSAGRAVPPTDAYGGHGGQGTFSVSGHENDYSWWIIVGFDKDGNPIRKLGTAIQPTSPMYNAVTEMQKQIRDCAREAFG